MTPKPYDLVFWTEAGGRVRHGYVAHVHDGRAVVNPSDFLKPELLALSDLRTEREASPC